MIIEALRHGETTAGHCYLGRTDAQLTPVGWQQMQDALHNLAPDDYDVIISSPLKRCAEFAQRWAGARVQYDTAIQEYDFGHWDGLNAEEIMQRWPDELTAFWNNPEASPPPQAETLPAFATRLEQVLNQLQQLKEQQKAQRVLLITHGGVIKCLQCLLHKQPLAQMFAYPVAHGSLHTLGVRR